MLRYDIENHFWLVEGDTDRVFSGKAMDYVDLQDTYYLDFLSRAGVVTKIDSHLLLADVVNEPIKAKLREIDIKSIRSLRESNSARILERETEAGVLRETLIS